MFVSLHNIKLKTDIMKSYTETSTVQNVFRILLALFMLYAGISHLSFNRIEFQAQVPDWIPISKNLVVILSGVAEIILALALALWKKQRAIMGLALAVFFVLVFPGNISQYINAVDSFGLNTDRARLIRLFFQPVLILWALWSAGTIKIWRNK
jgi:uncharacterized membrane protein